VFGPSSEPGNLEIRRRIPNHSTAAFVDLNVLVNEIELSALKQAFNYSYIQIVATARRQYLYF
jgi:hypothetical protein